MKRHDVISCHRISYILLLKLYNMPLIEITTYRANKVLFFKIGFQNRLILDEKLISKQKLSFHLFLFLLFPSESQNSLSTSQPCPYHDVTKM